MDQRYYASSYGRFNTADPFSGSLPRKNPGSWNLYNYTGGDPVNSRDPLGTCNEDDDFTGCDAISQSMCLQALSMGAMDWYYANCAQSAGGDGGGGGNTAPGGPGATSYGNARQAALTAQATEKSIKDTPTCDKVLSAVGKTFEQLQGAVASQVYSDGTTSSVLMTSLFVNSTPANYQAALDKYGNQTVQQYLQGSPYAAVACAGCASVYLNYQQFGGSLNPTNQAILMHEALHNLTGDTDLDLQNIFKAAGFKVMPGASSDNLTDLMTANCIFGIGKGPRR